MSVMDLTSQKPRALIGFDGYIDELQRVIRERRNETECTYFEKISEFASRLAAAAGVSADMETVTITRKLGGNGTILANALSRLGIDTTCIGAMGYPEINSVFSEMPVNCHLYSVCDPAYTHAFEFDDGKLMFANVQPLAGLTWHRISEHMGMDILRKQFAESDLIALVNWSGIPGTKGIWAGILQDILPYLSGEKRKFFFDIADPSKKPKEEILDILELISDFSDYGEVILGLNENEARQLAAVISPQTQTSIEEAGQKIFRFMRIQTLLIHPIDCCIAVSADGIYREQGTLVSHPVISTGGGDNFNAGFCYGWIQNMSLRESMQIGMRVSGWYVGHGYSPVWSEITDIN